VEATKAKVAAALAKQLPPARLSTMSPLQW